MHPSGFESRALACDEATALLSVAHNMCAGPLDERIRDILVSNSFIQKIDFIRNVFKGWLKQGRLGGRPSASEGPEIFWDGVQEHLGSGGSAGKFVWTTVGAPGGDGKYRSVSLKEKSADNEDPSMDALRERLQGLAVKS